MPWINPQHEQLVQLGKQSYLNTDVEVKFIPAPTGGWDSISPLSMMDPQYAVILDNWIPRPSWIEPRGGSSLWTNISSQPVETLMAYRPNSGIEQLFAATGSEIWDVSSLGAPVLVQSIKSTSRWQYINFTPASGANYLCLVNGVDPYLTYNGSSWVEQVITGPPSGTFINILGYKRRIWFVQNASTDAYYLGVDAIAGPATVFRLGSFMTKGGYLLAMGTWTLDGGQGPDDYLVFITSKGQAIIYSGIDPGSDFILHGVFDLPDPIGRRCLARVGSDLMYISLQGLLPLSQALPFNPSGVRSIALTNRIQNAMLMAAQIGNQFFGWSVTPFPLQSLIIMNVPIAENIQQQQYVMNPLNGSWCRFTGWNANCFEIFNNSLYYGDNLGNVVLGYVGTQDLGRQIELDVECAFNYLDAPGRVKNLSMLRPLFNVDTPMTLRIGVDVDFNQNGPLYEVGIIIPTGSSLWDSAIWDESLWTEAIQSIIDWRSALAIGTALAIRIKITLGASTPDGVAYISSGQGVPILRLNVFEALMQAGGPI